MFAEAQQEIDGKKQEANHIPILEVFRKYPKEVLTAMGMRLAENTSYYIFTVIVITYIDDFTNRARDLMLRLC